MSRSPPNGDVVLKAGVPGRRCARGGGSGRDGRGVRARETDGSASQAANPSIDAGDYERRWLRIGGDAVRSTGIDQPGHDEPHGDEPDRDEPDRERDVRTRGDAGSATGPLVARVSQLGSGRAVTFDDPITGDPGVIIKLRNGTFVAYDAVCTHAGCTVEYDRSSGYLSVPATGRPSTRRTRPRRSPDRPTRRWRRSRSISIPQAAGSPWSGRTSPSAVS